MGPLEIIQNYVHLPRSVQKNGLSQRFSGGTKVGPRSTTAGLNTYINTDIYIQTDWENYQIDKKKGKPCTSLLEKCQPLPGLKPETSAYHNEVI